MVEWSSRFEVGIEGMDDHHRDLADLIDRLRLCLVRNAGADEIGEVLEQLEHLTLEHFSAEEAHMERVGYPKLEEHRANHVAFAQRVSNARERHERGEAMGLGMLAMLRNWMYEHVDGADRQFGDFVVASHGTRSPLRRFLKRFAV